MMNSQIVTDTALEDLEEEDTLKDKYLTFLLGDEGYALPIRHVTEIIGIQKISRVPDTPEYIKGVVNLRGRVIPIIDVRLRFGLPFREYDERTCVVFVQVGKICVGLVVDSVSEVAKIPEQDVEGTGGRAAEAEGYVCGMGKMGDEIKILIDVGKLLLDGRSHLIGDIVAEGENA